MKTKRKLIPFALICAVGFNLLPFSACNETSNDNVLRVASWDEYIDEGGEDSYVKGSQPLYEEFEVWYKQVYGKEITVEYVTLQDNETMYNQIKMGNSYDLLCPSEYMCMKLAEEGYLQKLPTSFFDPSQEHNYYAQNVSPYIHDIQNHTNGIFNGKNMQLSNGNSLAEYVAGYMWGTTGFVFNPNTVDAQDVKSWNVLLNEKYHRKISAKDNVRDTYFMGLGMYYENELLTAKTTLNNGLISMQDYQDLLFEKMNDTSCANNVKTLLETMRGNIYGLETDEGKLDVITGRFDISYQWSGDAVYTLDMGEDEEMTEEPLYLEYCIPDSASNLFFDGWVLMKDSKQVDVATAFINFLSIPENVVRNMYYIGYTSCISGPTTGENAIYDYIQETYASTDEDNTAVPYDVSYFFGKNHILNVPEEQTRRQLFAQYPTTETINRLVVMKNFDKETNEILNRMWNTIK